jgi:hypothetical protein
MLNLYNQINNLDNWDYYSREDEFLVKKIDNWDVDKKHIEFINNFLKLSGKIVIIDFFKIKLANFKRSSQILEILGVR